MCQHGFSEVGQVTSKIAPEYCFFKARTINTVVTDKDQTSTQTNFSVINRRSLLTLGSLASIYNS